MSTDRVNFVVADINKVIKKHQGRNNNPFKVDKKAALLLYLNYQIFLARLADKSQAVASRKSTSNKLTPEVIEEAGKEVLRYVKAPRE